MPTPTPVLDRRGFVAGAAALALAPALAARRARAALVPEPFALEARKTTHLLAPGKAPATVWGFNGVVPGPVLRVRQGEELAVRLDNRLDQPTAVHWHGIRIANAMDGVPHMTQRPVEPGQSFDYRFVAPDAGTFWYHPHERSWEQVARGLFGALIVEEAEPPRVDQDLVLVINDWRVTGEGRLNEAFGTAHDRAHAGRLGNLTTVNGLIAPVFPVRRNERLRLRLLNASSARVLRLQLPGTSPHLIAVDGQPVAPAALYGEDLTLSPGNRVDLILDVLADTGAIELKDQGAKGEVIARLEVAGEPVRAEPLAEPYALKPAGIAEPDLAAAETVDLVMTGGAKSEMDMQTGKGDGPVWWLNGRAHMGPEPLFRVKRGTSVVVRMVNDTAWGHAMHVHGHHFRVPERTHGRLRPYWWDTVLVERAETLKVAFVADNPGKWMIHCHMLDHQAAGMDTWFEVG